MDERSGKPLVLVVGAGPAGLAAATSASECGASVLLLDENALPGGQIWRASDALHPRAAAFANQFDPQRVRLWAGATLIGAEQGSLLALYQGAIHRIDASSTILCTGARERFVPFPGWTLPGVIGVGGLQALVKQGLNIDGKRVVIAGTGPLLLAVAAALTEKGAEVIALAEQSKLNQLLRFARKAAATPSRVLDAIRMMGALDPGSLMTGWWIESCSEQQSVLTATLTNGRERRSFTCDWLATGYGLIPNLEVAMALGCDIRRGNVTVDFNQQTTVPGVFAAGETTGIGGVDKAIAEGHLAGMVASGCLHLADEWREEVRRQRSYVDLMDECFALRPELRTLADADTVICRCEDVRLGDLKHAQSLREAKLKYRVAMGACQGRTCGPIVDWLLPDRDIRHATTFRDRTGLSVRLPLKPVRVSELTVSQTTSQVASD